MSKIAIIDLDSVAFTIGHPNKVLDEMEVPLRVDNKFVYKDKTDEELLQAAEQVMSDIINKGQFTSYIGFIKGRGTTTSRKAINPEYKANRGSTPPVWWPKVKDILINKYHAIEVDNIEVDDAVNITRLNLPSSYIVAIDGDLLGLEGLHYNWRVNKWINVNTTDAAIKFWTDMIKGQPGDNIKGIPGKGAKYAENLFLKFNLNSSGVLDAYINHFKEECGIGEFYKNYKCLKILEKYEGFNIPTPVDITGIIKDNKYEKEYKKDFDSGTKTETE